MRVRDIDRVKGEGVQGDIYREMMGGDENGRKEKYKMLGAEVGQRDTVGFSFFIYIYYYYLFSS